MREPGGTEPVGEVSVGFARASVFGELPAADPRHRGRGSSAVAVGVLASLVLRRRLERLTLGRSARGAGRRWCRIRRPCSTGSATGCSRTAPDGTRHGDQQHRRRAARGARHRGPGACAASTCPTPVLAAMLHAGRGDRAPAARRPGRLRRHPSRVAGAAGPRPHRHHPGPHRHRRPDGAAGDGRRHDERAAGAAPRVREPAARDRRADRRRARGRCARLPRRDP